MARPRGAKARAEEVRVRLALEYPGAECALVHENAFQLLVATILSAQTTDENVNKVTPALFAEYPTAADLAHADPAAVEQLVFQTGFYRSKTKNLLGMARMLDDEYDGEVPTALEDLVRLPGVGPQDGQRRAVGGLRPAGTPRRHARRPPLPSTEADRPRPTR